MKEAMINTATRAEILRSKKRKSSSVSSVNVNINQPHMVELNVLPEVCGGTFMPVNQDARANRLRRLNVMRSRRSSCSVQTNSLVNSSLISPRLRTNMKRSRCKTESYLSAISQSDKEGDGDKDDGESDGDKEGDDEGNEHNGEDDGEVDEDDKEPDEDDGEVDEDDKEPDEDDGEGDDDDEDDDDEDGGESDEDDDDNDEDLERKIFVTKFDPQTTETELRRAFEDIGEVLNIELYINSNKGQNSAFVKFANKEQASQALLDTDIKISGKRCVKIPSKDVVTLYLASISFSWTKEDVEKRLAAYNIEGIKSFTFKEGEGFGFLNFYSHYDAVVAYKRLRGIDFGFSKGKVEFADPQGPPPEIAYKLKKVYLSSIPSHWDRCYLHQRMGRYGRVVSIDMARDLPSTSRDDFAFVQFSTHEAAMACIQGIKNRELGHVNILARLANPTPKVSIYERETNRRFQQRGGSYHSRGY